MIAHFGFGFTFTGSNCKCFSQTGGGNIVLGVDCSLASIMYKRYKRFHKISQTLRNIARIYENLKVLVTLLRLKLWGYFELPWITS